MEPDARDLVDHRLLHVGVGVGSTGPSADEILQVERGDYQSRHHEQRGKT